MTGVGQQGKRSAENPPPFYEELAVRRAIRTLGAAQEGLTVLVGAGVGREVGLPSWNALVSRLVIEAFRSAETSADDFADLQSVAESLIQIEGLLAAATLARTQLAMNGGRAHFIEALRSCLYRIGDTDVAWDTDAQVEVRSPRPGPLADAIAQLVIERRSRQCHVQLVTTNYDVLLRDALELAVRETPGRPNIRLFGPRDVGNIWANLPPGQQTLAALAEKIDSYLAADNTIHVVHLHGYVGTDANETDSPIFSESEYYAESSERGWQEAFLSRRLRDSSLLVVGASLTDPDILRILFKHGKPDSVNRVVGLLKRTRRDAAMDQPLPCYTDEKLHETLSLNRWRDIGMIALPYDHFYEQSQFVIELTNAIRDGTDRYADLRDRELSWYAAFCIARLGFTPVNPEADSPDKYRKREESFTRFQAGEQAQKIRLILQSVEGEVAAIAALGRAEHSKSYVGVRDDSVERFAIHIWSRWPYGRSLAMTLCSDRTWLSLNAINRRRLWFPSAFTAINAYCDGQARTRDVGRGVGHWNFNIAIPISLASYGALPVGVVALASSATKLTSQIRKLSHADRVRIATALTGVGQLLLDPARTLDSERSRASTRPSGALPRTRWTGLHLSFPR